MRKFIVILLAIVLATLFFPAASNATTSGDEYQFNSSSHTWTDIHCNGSQTWEVHFWNDAGWAGNSVRICSNTADFCEVPDSNNGSTGCTIFGSDSLNDEASSLTWHTYTGFPDTCISVRKDVSYAGTVLRLPRGNGSITYLGSYNIGNDSASSVSKNSPTSCVPA